MQASTGFGILRFQCFKGPKRELSPNLPSFQALFGKAFGNVFLRVSDDVSGSLFLRIECSRQTVQYSHLLPVQSLIKVSAKRSCILDRRGQIIIAVRATISAD